MKYKHGVNNIEEIKIAMLDWEKSNLSWREISKKYDIKISTLKYYYYERNKEEPTNDNLSDLLPTKRVQKKVSKKVLKPVIKNKKKNSDHEMYKYVIPRTDNEFDKKKQYDHEMYNHVISLPDNKQSQVTINELPSEETNKKKKVKRINLDDYINPNTGKLLY